MEFSSLGGWVATRASGMKKNVYGNIEDLVGLILEELSCFYFFRFFIYTGKTFYPQPVLNENMQYIRIYFI